MTILFYNNALYIILPYSWKYWRRIKIGGLAVLRAHHNLNPPIIFRVLCDIMSIFVDPVTAKLVSADFDFPPFSSNPPNLIPANMTVSE